VDYECWTLNFIYKVYISKSIIDQKWSVFACLSMHYIPNGLEWWHQ